MSSDPQTPLLARRATLLGALALGGCGFRPAFGSRGGAEALRNQVGITVPQTVAGFRMREAIAARLGPADTPKFQLSVTLTDDRTPAAITAGGDTARFDLNGQSDWVLTALDTGAVVGQGQVRSFTSYSATGSTVATQSAEDAARARLVTALADLIVADLTLAVTQ